MGLLTPARRPARIVSPHTKDIAVRGFTASAVEVVPRGNAQQLQRLHEDWQDGALSFYDRCGECREAANIYSRAVSQLRFYPALRENNGEVNETDDPTVLELFRRVQDRTGGRDAILDSFGKLMFLIGDGYMTVTGTGDEEDPEVWEFLSPTELRLNGDEHFIRLGAQGDQGRPLKIVSGNPSEPLNEGEIRAWRMWRRHPARSWRADAPMHAVLDLFEELVLLTAAVRARVKSRLASAGILILPDEISFPEEDSEAAGGEDPEQDPFMARLIEHMTQPIMQEGTASAVVPFLLRASQQYVNDIRHIKLHDPNETYRETGLRMETIKRIAIGLDMPPEILLGLTDSNHWVGWLVSEEFAKAHIFPVADLFASDLASAYLRPAARAMDFTDWRRLTIGYDPAKLVTHPDRSQNAKDLFDRGEISGASLRVSNGFKTADEPTEEERRTYLAIKLHDAQLLTDEPINDPPAEKDQTGNDENEDAPPSPFAQRLLGAAEFQVIRARALAGARMRRKSQGCEECRETISNVHNEQVVAALGTRVVADLGSPSPRELVRGSADEFTSAATRLGVSETVARALGDQVEAFAAKTLYEMTPGSLPPGFEAFIAQLEAA